MTSTSSTGDLQRTTFFVRGRVQGVGFRWWTRSRALELGLTGFARNMDDGRVEVWAQGPREAIDRLGQLLQETPSSTGRPGHVQAVVAQEGDPRDGLDGFVER